MIERDNCFVFLHIIYPIEYITYFIIYLLIVYLFSFEFELHKDKYFLRFIKLYIPIV